MIVRFAALGCLCAALSGCAALATTLGVQVLVGAAVCAAKGDVICAGESVGGAHAVQVDYPSAAVYRGFVAVAEADGRKIVASDDTAQTLSVSYPFSLLANNWGGEIVIHCKAEGQGTRVLFEHGNHDAASRVKKIETRMLDEALGWLRHPAGQAYLAALRDEPARQN